MATNRGSLGAAALAVALLCAGGSASAAEGHHSVENAMILEAGQCELESWISRGSDRGRLLHGGVNCGIGPVEVGAAGEYARFAGESETTWGVEVKWATELGRGFSIGAKVGPAWAAHERPRYQGVSASALATWKATEALALHANFGRDFANGAENEDRYGAAIEWSPAQAWSLVAERYKEGGTHFVRAGVRLLRGEDWSVDLSRSRRLSGPGVSAWTLGATWAFDRK